MWTSIVSLLCLGMASANEIVLVTGATGRTGALVYKGLRACGHSVRALVRDTAKAHQRLDCTRCDPSEGIFKGDVTRPAELQAAFDGVSSVVILTSSYPVKLPNGSWTYPDGGWPEAVDWRGTENQLQAAKNAGARRAVLVSSMGTTQPDSFLDMLGGGHVLFYKLQAEVSMMAISSMNFTIVKPSGLVDEHGGHRKLLVGRNDELGKTGKMTVPRADVAAVVCASVGMPSMSGDLRFDLSSDPDGPPTTDFAALFEHVRHAW
jgi:nucleoside-diphosphate-sugar epimerase